MNTSTFGRGLGITAGLDAGLARDLAARCEQLGYHSLWSNDEPASPGLETLAHFATTAPQLTLGVGALPLDRHQPVRIAAEIDRLGLDPAKLWIGIGSGQLRSPIEIVQRAVAELRELLPADSHRRRSHATAAVPRRWRDRRRRPAQLDAARPSGAGAADGCTKAPRRRDAPPRSSPRTSASPWAPARWQRLRDEEGHYRKINEAIAQHFEAMDVPLGSVGVAASNDQQYSKDWRHTTPRSTFPSHACSQNTMRLRSSPSQMPRRPEARRPSTRTTTQEGSQIGQVRATTVRAAGITWPPPDIGPPPSRLTAPIMTISRTASRRAHPAKDDAPRPTRGRPESAICVGPRRR